MKIQGVPVARDGDIVDCGCSYGSNRLLGVSSASLLGVTAGSNGSDDYSETAGGVAGNYKQGQGAGNGAVNETVATNGAVNGGIVTEIKRAAAEVAGFAASAMTEGVPAASFDEAKRAISSVPPAELDKVQTGLDVAGAVPTPAEIPANVANAGISAARGNYGDAALSAASIVPGVGLIVKGAKLSKGAELIKLSEGVGKPPSHLIEKHVGKDISYLKNRLAEDKNISSASTFSDLPTTEKAVDYALTKHQTDIAQFLKSPKYQLTINETYSDPVGIVLDRGATTPQVTNSFKLLLRKDPSMPDGFKLHTGYPEK
jgi:filamentous hemagglutinin